MSELKQKWIPFAELVEIVGRDKLFKSCPICSGQVMQRRDMMIPRLAEDPKCLNCETQFKPRKKWLLLRGFLIISPQKTKQGGKKWKVTKRK